MMIYTECCIPLTSTYRRHCKHPLKRVQVKAEPDRPVDVHGHASGPERLTGPAAGVTDLHHIDEGALDPEDHAVAQLGEHGMAVLAFAELMAVGVRSDLRVACGEGLQEAGA